MTHPSDLIVTILTRPSLWFHEQMKNMPEGAEGMENQLSADDISIEEVDEDDEDEDAEEISLGDEL